MADQSNLRNQLRQRAQGGQVVRQEEGAAPLAVVVRRAIDRQSAAFKAVLPAHVDHDRFARLTLVAIKANRKLVNAFSTDQGQTSVLLSCMQAAALGLEPNTPTQECWLIPRRGRDASGAWVDECELQIGYRGYVKLARKTGTVKSIFAEVVRESDHFRFARGLEADLFEHEQAGDESPLTHVYAIVRYKEGGADFVVLNRRQVEKRRAVSESFKRDQSKPDATPTSPWNVWDEEMWKKTALRQLTKMIDLDPMVDQAAAVDEHKLELRDGAIVAAPVAQHELEPAPAPDDYDGRDLGQSPEAAERSAAPPEGVDGETGEVTDPPMTEAQKKALFAYLKTADIEDRGDRLAWASGTLGREVKTYNDLTVSEASKLIDAAAEAARAADVPPPDGAGQ